MGENDGDELEGVCGAAATLRALCGSSSGQVRREKQQLIFLGFKNVFHECSQCRAAGTGQKCLSYLPECEIATLLWPFSFFSIYTCEATVAAQ